MFLKSVRSSGFRAHTVIDRKLVSKIIAEHLSSMRLRTKNRELDKNNTMRYNVSYVGKIFFKRKN